MLQALPVPPEEGEEADGEHGGKHVVAAPHERRGKLGGGGDAHQDDGDDGQHDVDALAQQDAGIVALQLDRLLLVLLLELQLGDSGLTRLHGLLGDGQTRERRERARVGVSMRGFVRPLTG